jgi:uncharacterized protein (TIGR02118 family)
MINLTVMYPFKEGEKFDKDYYADKHMKLVSSLPHVRGIKFEFGLAGLAPNTPPTYISVAQISFDSIEDMMGDISSEKGQEVLQT